MCEYRVPPGDLLKNLSFCLLKLYIITNAGMSSTKDSRGSCDIQYNDAFNIMDHSFLIRAVLWRMSDKQIRWKLIVGMIAVGLILVDNLEWKKLPNKTAAKDNYDIGVYQ